MTSVGVLCRLFAGAKRSDRLVRLGAARLMKDQPIWEDSKPQLADVYYWYYGSYALFQYGGKHWTRWNQRMQKALLKSQRRGGDEDGSWDPVGPSGRRVGRVYSTAMGAMTLEVYYRFRRATSGEGFLR